MSKERFLNYTDAIVAIVATIMVLQLPLPQNATFHALSQEGLPFFAYLLSFAVIWVVWYNHHSLFEAVRKVNVKVYWYNGFWVFTMSLFPVATAWVGRNPNLFLPELFYLLIIFLWSLAFSLMEAELIREGEYARTSVFYSKNRQYFYYVLLGISALVIWFLPIFVLLSVFIFATYGAYEQIKFGGIYVNRSLVSTDKK